MVGSIIRRRRIFPMVAGLVLSTLVVPIGQQTASAAPPTFAKAFAPSTIGPGSATTLTFTITNPDPVPAVGLAFSDALPAAVTIAAPANLTNTCQGTVSTAAGSGSISLIDGRVAASRSCTISVDVTASTPGVHTNNAGDLTSSNGNSGTATADLTVATDRPGFTKSFAPSTVDLGERSTLTFTIDNTANASAVTALSFTDTLPVGLVIANPSGATTTCGNPTIPPTLTATAGSNTISLRHSGGVTFPSVAAGASCTVVVDVVATAAGALGNSSGELISGNLADSSGKANAVLTSTVSALHLTKQFTNDPIAPGRTATLQFSITNFARSNSAIDVAFDDDLGATLAGLVAVAPLPTDPCGAGSTVSGSSVLSLSGGSVAPGGSCTFSVSVAVPIGATGAGDRWVNTTTAVTGIVGGAAVVGNQASDTLFILEAPTLTKEFTDDPVAPGSSVTLHFEITDNSSTGSTDIAFSDELTTFLAFPITATFPADGFCGPGSSSFLISPTTGAHSLAMTGGSLASGATCAFDVVIAIPAGFTGNVYTNTTEAITATVGGSSVTGGTATDDLVVIAAPKLVKEFIDDPVAPGGTTTLQFTIQNGEVGDDTNEAALGTATGITFTDNLALMPPGITAVGLPLNDVCGIGSVLSASAGNTLLTLTGGTLDPLTSCSFDVTVQTSASMAQGIFGNTTSALTATVLGSTVTSAAPSDDLIVADIALTKEFIDDPVLAGGQVTLEFSIVNNSPTADATDIQFSDDLDDALSGLAATGGPLSVSVCGGTLTGASGNRFLSFSGGSVPAGTSCSFSVVLDVPASAEAATYTNTTSRVFMTIGGDPAFLPAAIDDLVVADDPSLGISKAFTNNPVNVGENANMRITISNPSVIAVDDIAFTDDLAAMGVTGLAATGLPLADPCGAASSLSGSVGNTLLTLSGGSLAAGGTCTFDVSVAVPGSATGGIYTNTTSTVTGTVDGSPVVGAAAMANLFVNSPQSARADLSITKTDSVDPVLAGGTLVYTITVANAGPSLAQDVVATDALPVIIDGEGNPVPLVSAATTAGCAQDPNGVNSCSLGNIPVGGEKSYTVTVTVNSDTIGTMTNTATVRSATTDPNSSNNTATEDTLVLSSADLSITKTDSMDPVFASTSLTYTITVANAGPSDAIDVVVTDTLPAGVALASTAGCAEDPTGAPSCSLGSIAAGSSKSYTVTVDVDPSTLGTITNSASVVALNPDPDTSNNSTTEDTDVLATADLSITKTDDIDPVVAGTSFAYTITVTNHGPADARDVVVQDNFPGPLGTPSTTGCAEDPNGESLCNLGTIEVGTSKSYTIDVDVPFSIALGTITNTASVTASTPEPGPSTGANNSTSEDTEIIGEADLSITKTDSVDPVTAGDPLTYTITVSNAGPSSAADVTVEDTLPAGVTFDSTAGCVEDPNGVSTCSLGTLDAGGSRSYTITVDVDSGTEGTITNTATVSATTPDPDTSNNSASQDTEVEFGADLSITKVDDVDPIRAHSDARLIYTITVTNNGPFDAENVVVTDVLPSAVKFKQTNGCLEHKSVGVPTCTLGTIAAGQSASYTIEVKMKTDSPLGIMTNSATVSSSTEDSDTSNNTATETTLVCRRVSNGQCAGFGNPIAAQTVESIGPITPSGGLPVTGSDSFNSLMTMGLVALALGLALFGTSRRRETT